MFTKEELGRGAKRAVLEYIAEASIKISRIYSTEEAIALEKAGTLNDVIVRSDSPEQWDGFSGVYESRPNIPTIGLMIEKLITKPDQRLPLNELLALATLEYSESIIPSRESIIREKILTTSDDVHWYCAGRCLPIPGNPTALIQDMHEASSRLFQHPNNKDLVVLGGLAGTRFFNREKSAFWDLDRDKPDEIDGDLGTMLEKAIEIYDRATSLLKFSEEYSYEMEFGRNKKDEVLVYQIRRFRKKEEAAYTLEQKSGECIVNFKLPIGITPAEGMQLTYHNSPFIKKLFNHDYEMPDLRQGITYVSSSGDRYSSYPHVICKDVSSLIYPSFHYSHSHGARESLMKIPLILCGILGENLEYPKNHHSLEIFKEGSTVIAYSDGIRGRIEIGHH